MSSQAIQRLESLLQTRQLEKTLADARVRHAAEVVSTGSAAMDAALGGGWPKGEVSELVGPRSTGRTSLLLSTLADATRQGGVVGLIDAFDRFDPVAAARLGLDLARLLWVRGPTLGLERLKPAATSGPGPGASFDQALRQAIRAFDLLVRSGGFAVAALDLADVPPRDLRGLPMTTWLRLAHANEGRDTVCLLVGNAPMGRSARGISARVDAARRWSGTHAQSRRFEGFDVRVQVASARMALEGAYVEPSRRASHVLLSDE